MPDVPAGGRRRQIVQRLAAVSLACALAILSGCEQTDSVQWGYRGSSMIQLYKPGRLYELRKLNEIPPPEPSDPYDPSFPMATEVHQNVQVLTDLNALEFARLMNAMSTWVAPEEGCAYCHNPENLASDEKYTKLVARDMLRMTRHINTSWKTHVASTGVTCWTCHRGKGVPSDIWFQRPWPKTPSAGVTGSKAGQNLGGVAINGNSSLPFDPLTPFLEEDNQIAVQGTEILPYGNRRSIKQAEWTYSLMMYFSKSLGVNCTYCHHTRAMGVWDQSTPQRVTAWHGIRMVRDLNQSYLSPLKPLYPDERLGPLGDAPKAACATCHKGSYKPLFGVSMLGDYPSLAGVLPGRLKPVEGAESAAPAVEPQAAEEAPAAEAEAAPEEAPAESVAEGPGEPVEPEAEALVPEGEAATEAQQREPETTPVRRALSESIAAVTILRSIFSGATTSEAPSAPAAGEGAAEEAAARGLIGAETAQGVLPAVGGPALAAGSISALTLSEIQDALEQLLGKLQSVRGELATVEAVPGEELAAETPSAEEAEQEAATAAELEKLRARLGEQAAQLEAAKQAAAALTGAEERIAAVEARLEQERAALQQQLELVRAERDAAVAAAAEQPSDETVGDVGPEPSPQDQQQLLAELEAAKKSAAALTEAERRITAAEARLDQERTALQQQLEVVRAQRDAAATGVEQRLTKEHAAALDAAQSRIRAVRARLDQERHALQQQLEVVRAQRDTVRNEIEERLVNEHQRQLADVQRKLAAATARLRQERHALQQQLQVVRAQRDTALQEAASRIDRKAHEAALAAAEQRVGAYRARLVQQVHALDQQLDVVRAQRDGAVAQAESRVSRDEYRKAVEDLEGRIRAVQARLEQQRHALEQQLAVVRAQRNAALEETDARVAELSAEHEKALDAMQQRIAAREARLAQEREALQQQLAVVREQRDASTAGAEPDVEALRKQLAEAQSRLEGMEQAHAAEIDALNSKLADADEAIAELRGKVGTGEPEQAREPAAAQRTTIPGRSLVDEATELGGQATDEGVFVRLGGDVLQFASGSAALPAQVPSLDRIAELMQARPDVRARIEGYTDSVGSNQLNQALSKRRAEAVLQRLAERGVDRSRLTAEGLGEERPIGDNATPQGRSENRRVEVYLIAGSEGPDAG